MDFNKLLEKKYNSHQNIEEQNLQHGGNDNNTNSENNNISELMNDSTNIKHELSEESVSTMDHDTMTQSDVNLDEEIIKGKQYINLLIDNHHYFINYHDCIKNGNKIIEINKNNNVQEIKNNIKLTFAKYKQGKNYNYDNELNTINVLDKKTNKIIDKLKLPIAIDLDILINKEENVLNNLYMQVKNSYDLLIQEPQYDDEKINTFKKLRTKLEKKINTFYTIQYVLNFLLKNKNINQHYILHTVEETYNSTSEDKKYLLQLKNSNINNKSLQYLLETDCYRPQNCRAFQK